MKRGLGVAALVLAAALCAVHPHSHRDFSYIGAYIGPGAGFAFLESLLTVVISFFASVFSILLWPVRMLIRTLRRGRGLSRARVGKLIFLGLDGFDPAVAEKLLAEGKLPNLKKLSYSRLRTTYPPLSPVAWSTFATGVNPGKHNIFDFLNRDLRSYVPELSSAKVRRPDRVLHVGKWKIPLSRPSVEMRRKSQPFWKILGSHAVPCTILRIPITFPPEPFEGRLLSAMCTPDLRGTQGTFTLFTEGGSNCLTRVDGGWEGNLEGPENDLVEGAGPLRIPFRLARANGGWTLQVQGASYPLHSGEYTPWVKLRFATGRGIAVRGIARFLLTREEPAPALYATPVQIDPEHPALPISRPAYYANYLAKLLGSFATLGMAEDTWALNEGAIDHEAFLKQAAMIQQEREAMFFSALEHTRRGVVACVFDTTDRVQHMCFRDRDVIERLYRDMDRLVGQTMAHVDSKTALFVLSDHGFCAFDRGINLNTWLLQNGYLALREGSNGRGGEYFADVDWSRTAAYTLGLSGVYLNLRGRESQGIVAPENADQLKKELIQELAGLVDPARNIVGIRNVYASSAIYRGPYTGAAPDLIIGYADGYRASWDAASGRVTRDVFEDNLKPWCGDHCVDPALVPGVLFSNRTIDAGDPGIEDMAPTALGLFGIEPPAWMEGESVIRFA